MWNYCTDITALVYVIHNQHAAFGSKTNKKAVCIDRNEYPSAEKQDENQGVETRSGLTSSCRTSAATSSEVLLTVRRHSYEKR